MLLIPLSTKAQPHTTIHTNVLWMGYGSMIRFHKKWSVMNDVQLRTTNWADKWLLYGFRAGLNYDITRSVAVAAGLTLFEGAQYAGEDLFFKNEWRPWEEISCQVSLKKINLSQRLRTEQRFLQQVVDNRKTKNYQYIFRVRYRFEWQFPLKENKIKLLAGNEIFLNPGYLSNSLFFDQNRAFTGLSFKLSSNTNLQGQYLKIFQWRSNTSVLEDQNAFRVNIYQQFRTRKFNKSRKTA